MKSLNNCFYRVLSGIALTAAVASAGAIPQGPSTYLYNLSLPTFTNNSPDGGTFNFEFSWLGPLEFNAPPNSSCVDGCPVNGTIPGSPQAGYVYNGALSDFTATTGPTACSTSPSGGCAQVDLTFTQQAFQLPLGGGPGSFAPPTLTFTLIEPDAFWATTGFQNFPSNMDSTGVGAGYVFSGGAPVQQALLDCTNCSVQTTAAPEPGSSTLVLAGLAGCLLVLCRRVRRTA